MKLYHGGQSENGNVVRNPQVSQQKTIPNGMYDLVDNDADTRHVGWFRLDKQDGNRFNDKDDSTGRDGFRLHLGSVSWGCITCDNSKDNRVDEWEVLSEIINNTSSETVKEKRGNQSKNPFSYLKKYGEVKVTGEDNVPLKQ